ncbi:MAG: protein phosphatase 2C domain-containing protein [Dehalococcoidia bacterium]|jgi:protein phosphatase|nr:protein phosphatase 2C domain-containing protein [Dehalococcoidia bacterium]
MTATRKGTAAQLAIGSMTHQGRVRTSNEDATAALLPPNIPNGCGGLMIVCDGMGGHQAGDYASNLAVNTVVSHLRNTPADALSPGRAAESLHAAAEAANAKVFGDSGTIERAGMGSTLTAAIISGPVLALAHVGDSRAYLLRDGELALLTTDHTWVADRVLKGALSREEAESHSKRNVLLRALGAGESVEIDSAMVQIQVGDVILLSSDGLHGPVSGADIASVLGALPPQQAAAELVERANAAGGPDNVTAVVAHVLSTEINDPNSDTETDPGATLADGGGFGPRLASAVRRLSHRG